MTWVPRALVLLLAVGTTAAATAPGAMATPTAPVDLGVRAGSIADLQTTAAADGSATVVYTQDGHAFVATKQPGATLGTPTDLGAGLAPRLATTSAGRSVLAWIDNSGATPTVRVALREPGADRFTELTSTAVLGVDQLAAHAAADGRLFVAYGTSDNVTLWTIPTVGALVSTAMEVPASGLTGMAIGSQTGADPTAWVLVTSKSGGTARTTLRRWSAGLGASAISVLGADTDATTGTPGFTTTTIHQTSNPTVIPGARPAFFWTKSTFTSSSFLPGLGSVTSELRRADEVSIAAPPATVDTLSSTGFSSETTRFPTASATDDTGAGLVAWGSRSGTIGLPTSNIAVARHTAAGGWDPTTALSGLFLASPPSRLTGLALARTAAGGAQLAYVRDNELLTTRLSPTGTLNQPTPSAIPLAGSDAPSGTISAAGAGNGDTAIAWSVSGTGSTSGVQVSYDDVTPPTLSAAATSSNAIPAIGFSDQATADRFNEGLRRRSYRATAADLWSPSTITWDFGDGSTATGTDAVHQFATAGRKTVTVTARDAGGNTTTTTVVDDVPSVSPLGSTAPQAAARLTSASLTPKRFRSTRGAIGKGKGTTVSFQLTAPATVAFSVVARVRGFRAGKTCVSTRPKGKPARRCTTTKTLTANPGIAGVAGANTAPFGGRAAGAALKPGSYKLRVAIKGSTAGAIELPFTVRR